MNKVNTCVSQQFEWDLGPVHVEKVSHITQVGTLVSTGDLARMKDE